ncbi:hypothetical protein JHW43_000918 [Diplocarpon mali]|nr:hypothetical protein JHW43_000918 [Diplocarpon mali]
MSAHEKKPRAPANALRTSSTKPPLTAPPRVALRCKAEQTNGAAAPDGAATSPPGTGDAAAASVRVAERGRRVAQLESELGAVEADFERGGRRLSRMLAGESEAARLWQRRQQQHAAFLETDSELRLLRREVAGGEDGDREGDRDVKSCISSLVLDRETFREAYNEAMAEVRRKEEEVSTLQGQVRGLKSWVSSSSRVSEQMSDEVLGEEMRRLGNGLQNWVITNFRRAKIDPDKADASTRDDLERLVPTYETLASSSKIHFIQSVVSHLLVEHVFSAYFVGISREAARDLSNVEHNLSHFGSTESMNQWRATTLSILCKCSQKLQTETATVVETVVEQTNKIVDSIGDSKHTENRDKSLRTLVTSSVELSRLLRVQKAVFSIVMPCIESFQRTMFDADIMEDIGGEDEDTLNGREIRCVTFPGIVKTGDENGDRSHLKNTVAKIRVLCEPD